MNASHKRVKLSNREEQVLNQLLRAYKAWWRQDDYGEKWAEWIHTNLNDDSNNPMDPWDKGHLSLEIILGWSAARISVVVLVPIALSLAIGLWFNSRDWTDLLTIQAAWAIASYIVTAGGRKFFLIIVF